jgi:hypothetical protein
MDSVLRPRDIQARIRSGESPETVAAAAQTTVEKIMPFAQPVLAERAFVAQQAQRASVRRRAGDGAPGQLGSAVAQRLTADDLDPEDVEWDAWRRDDGRWTLVAAYDAAGGPERAEFVYDAAGRYVTATDESSRRLVGERLTPASPPATPVADAHGGPDAAPDAPDQMHLGDDAIELVTGRRPAPPVEEVAPSARPAEPVTPLRAAPAVDREPQEQDLEVAARDSAADDPGAAAAPASGERDEITVDLTEPAHAVRRNRPVADSDWMATQASERPPVPEAEALFEVPPAAAEPTSPDSPDSPEDPEGPASSEAPEAPAEESRPSKARAAKASKGSKGRAAIPSWDEIMFGSSTND